MEKDRHLDWHFRVSQRMTESMKRGQSRSWYVGEEVRSNPFHSAARAYIACSNKYKQRFGMHIVVGREKEEDE
jgi:hypothetical protein